MQMIANKALHQDFFIGSSPKTRFGQKKGDAEHIDASRKCRQES
jgi:hypothetical protein